MSIKTKKLEIISLMEKKKQVVLINKREFYRNLARLALPIALQSLMLAAVAAGDALMLGKVAQDEMTAVSLATQIQFVQNMFLDRKSTRLNSSHYATFEKSRMPSSA